VPGTHELDDQLASTGALAVRHTPVRLDRTAAVDHALLVLAPLVTVFLFVRYLAAHQLGVDYAHSFWLAGWHVRSGLSPYDLSRPQIMANLGFPYFAFDALLLVPASLLPANTGAVMAAVLALVSCLVALRLLDVGDWRVYALTLLLWPVINGWQTANLTLFLVCGLAATWRYRDAPLRAGAVAGLMLVVKPVVWPLGLWFLATRRFKASAVAVAVAGVLSLASWAILGFGQIGAWWRFVHTQTDLLYRFGYSVSTLMVRLGTTHTVATAIQLAVTAAITARCLWLGMRGRARASFTLAVALMLISSPLVDNHYFALLVVPLAIAFPELKWPWVLALGFWLCPAMDEAVWQVILAWLLVTVLCATPRLRPAPA
jgi:hypothetical protein